MARLDYIGTYERSFYVRLIQNLPTGYTADMVINTDMDVVQTMDAPYLKQSTVILDRNNSSAGGLTARTECLHTISVLVDKDNGTAKRGATDTAKEIMALFENVYFEGMYCLEATPEKVGDEPSTNLYRYDININFYFEGN
ncbi:hypothetical protein OAA60_03480 [Porticoccaceae bacterium]|nr:hypothetical protein [Porticoccaceae bacterium]